jgi:hypothetical protein
MGWVRVSTQPRGPSGPGEIPAETVRGARAAFQKESLAIQVRGELGVLFTDERPAPCGVPHRAPSLVLAAMGKRLTTVPTSA